MRAEPSSSPLLEVVDLSVDVGTPAAPNAIVRNVSFTLRDGRTLCMIGESGSGKSMTMRAIMGLTPRAARCSGSVRFRGRNLIGLAESELRQIRGRDIAMVFQEPLLALDPVFSIEQQIVETLRAHRRCSRAEAGRRALELLELVKIPAAATRRHAMPHQLSGGMRQRAMIAVALACRPGLLLADEPTTALDATVQIQILLLLKKLQAEMGMAMLFVTHDLGVAAHVADDIAVMQSGEIVEFGPAQRVLRQPEHACTRMLLACADNTRRAADEPVREPT